MSKREKVKSIVREVIGDIEQVEPIVKAIMELEFVDSVEYIPDCSHSYFKVEEMHPYGDKGKICTDCGKFLGMA